jgi:branched-subunit amino acid aminotransferase/4-amino-4-deoxychorismate lyase
VIWIDGAFVEGGEPTAEAWAAEVVAPFEAIGLVGGHAPLWSRHMARWRRTLARLGIESDAGEELQAVASELSRRNGHEDGILRLCRAARPQGNCTWMTTRLRENLSIVRLLPTLTRRPRSAPSADLKTAPRAFYDSVRNEARAGGADDGIVVAADGSVLETAVGNLWLRIDGGWVTPALDGRVLPGIGREVLLEQMAAAGRAVAERRCGLPDLHRAEVLAVSNAVYGPRPATLSGTGVAESYTELAMAWPIPVR